MTNQQVANEWYMGREAKTANIFVEGNIIYSYGHHFPMASFNNGAILFTTESYSNTTAKHKLCVFRAIDSTDKVFHVPDVLAQTKEQHIENVRSYNDRIEYAITKRDRARKYKDFWQDRITELTHERTEYYNHFID